MSIKDHVNALLQQARALAHQTMTVPKSEREYLLACGRYKQLVEDARSLKEVFLDPEARADRLDVELPDDDQDNPAPAPAPRRAQPQRDRLNEHRSRHVPRSI